jgi:hypothetical protein
LPQALIALSAPFFSQLLATALRTKWENIPNGAVTILSRMFLFSMGKATMNAPRYWKVGEDACSAIVTSTNTPCFSHPYGAANLLCAIGN